jgi:hypothetical protein
VRQINVGDVNISLRTDKVDPNQIAADLGSEFVKRIKHELERVELSAV